MDLAIKELKKNKAAGNDELTNELIIESYQIIKDHILKLMKVCIQYGHTPKIWQQNKSKILAKPGKDNYNVAKSYRIITLSSNMLKILEKLILWHLQDYLKIEQSLKKTQYGF